MNETGGGSLKFTIEGINKQNKDKTIKEGRGVKKTEKGKKGWDIEIY